MNGCADHWQAKDRASSFGELFNGDHLLAAGRSSQHGPTFRHRPEPLRAGSAADPVVSRRIHRAPRGTMTDPPKALPPCQGSVHGQEKSHPARHLSSGLLCGKRQVGGAAARGLWAIPLVSTEVFNPGCPADGSGPGPWRASRRASREAAVASFSSLSGASSKVISVKLPRLYALPRHGLPRLLSAAGEARRISSSLR
jgi:hypothetical protein